MPRGYSPVKVRRKIDALRETGKPFTLVDEAKKLNLTSKQFLSFLRETRENIERVADPHQNCMAGNYARYQFVKQEGIRT
jgi:hypothetical protein